jgi:hypothetical protein
MKSAILGLLLLGIIPIFFQALSPELIAQALPDAPSTMKLLAEKSGEDTNEAFTVQPIKPRVPSLVIRPVQREASRVVDRNFIIGAIFQIGATVADVESTQYGLSHGAREGNPLFGERPSRAKQYGFALPISGAVTLWSYHLKKHAPHSRSWLIPQIAGGAVHVTCAGLNLRSLGNTK